MHNQTQCIVMPLARSLSTDGIHKVYHIYVILVRNHVYTLSPIIKNRSIFLVIKKSSS